MRRTWPGYLAPLRHDYPLGWRSASVLAGIRMDERLTISDIARRFRLGYYDARQIVRRLERRGLLEVVGERRGQGPGRPPLVYRRAQREGWAGSMQRLRAIGELLDTIG
jgi:predicted ArsR family transcriptional regulator